MEFLIDVIFDWLLEPMLRGLRKLYDVFFDHSRFHPRVGTLGMVLVCLAGVVLFAVSMLLLAAERWETQIVILKWVALAGAGLVLFALAFAALGRLSQWLKKRKEAMYDHRNRK